MTLRRRPGVDVLAEIRDWFERGYVDAASERLESFASSTTDEAVLRDALRLACEALRMPAKMRNKGRPPNPLRPSELAARVEDAHVIDGSLRATLMVDLSELAKLTPMTGAQKLRMMKEIAADNEIARAVEELEKKLTREGAFHEVARVRKLTEPKVRKAFYRVRPPSKV